MLRHAAPTTTERRGDGECKNNDWKWPGAATLVVGAKRGGAWRGGRDGCGGPCARCSDACARTRARACAVEFPRPPVVARAGRGGPGWWWTTTIFSHFVFPLGRVQLDVSQGSVNLNVNLTVAASEVGDGRAPPPHCLFVSEVVVRYVELPQHMPATTSVPYVSTRLNREGPWRGVAWRGGGSAYGDPSTRALQYIWTVTPASAGLQWAGRDGRGLISPRQMGNNEHC